MAIEPVYNDKTDLLSRLRMSETTDAETLTVIDQVIQDVRTGFYRKLGLDRAIQIQGYTSVENPTTVEGVLRSVAEVTEVYWVMFKLFCILPHMYIETQYPIQNSFDDVPITRDADSLQKYKDCLWASIQDGLGQLVDPELEDTETGYFKAFSVGRVDSDGAPDPFILSDNTVGLPGLSW